MSGSEYTLTGFSYFLERRRVTFVNPLPNIRVCGVCGIVPARTLLLPCGQVLCEPCRAQIKGRELCPFHDEDCLEADVVVLDFKLSELDKHVVLCPSVRCPKCGQPVVRNVAVDHRRRCSGAADPGHEASTAETDSDVIRELRDVRKGLERLLEQALSDEFDKVHLMNYVNSLAERLADFERGCTKVHQDPVSNSPEDKLASTMKRLPFNVTPFRAASKPNVFIAMSTFSEVYKELKSLAKEQKASITNELDVIGGYSFQLECVIDKDTNGEVSVCFTFTLGDGAWDDRLYWPFARDLTIILTHPTDSERDIRLPVSLSDYEMAKKPPPDSWNEGSTTRKVSWKDVEHNGFVDDGTIYANVELV
ncbi:hypothetical protein HPB49_000539 [Dermacentor silvarum]|uniref:Uncharacterized protein n=1 Tax=Dermacentor silvarum TaxID=543639 RepID=A0ACB8DLQ3_DERSI|nr:hypothetical protein HPB49_000539 [Dermacentor silvarum]